MRTQHTVASPAYHLNMSEAEFVIDGDFDSYEASDELDSHVRSSNLYHDAFTIEE